MQKTFLRLKQYSRLFALGLWDWNFPSQQKKNPQVYGKNTNTFSSENTSLTLFSVHRLFLFLFLLMIFMGNVRKHHKKLTVNLDRSQWNFLFSSFLFANILNQHIFGLVAWGEGRGKRFCLFQKGRCLWNRKNRKVS